MRILKTEPLPYRIIPYRTVIYAMVFLRPHYWLHWRDVLYLVFFLGLYYTHRVSRIHRSEERWELLGGLPLMQFFCYDYSISSSYFVYYILWQHYSFYSIILYKSEQKWAGIIGRIAYSILWEVYKTNLWY